MDVPVLDTEGTEYLRVNVGPCYCIFCRTHIESVTVLINRRIGFSEFLLSHTFEESFLNRVIES